MLSWNAALDCDENPMAGYNVYRRAASESTFTKLNSEILDALTFQDTNDNVGTLYYYAICSVDDDGDESVKSISMAPAASSLSRGGPEAAAGCFVSAVSANAVPNMAIFLSAVVFTLIMLLRLGSRRARSPGS